MQHHSWRQRGWGPQSPPNANPNPGSDGTGSPRGLQLVGKGKVTPATRYRSLEQGAQGSSSLAMAQERDRTARGGSQGPHRAGASRGTPQSWGIQRDPTEPGPPEGPLPLELVVAQGGHSPGPQGVVNGFGKFIHVFPFLFTLITEIPYTKHSPSSPPPALEQRDLSQGNTDMSCSLRNAGSQGTAFLPVLPFLFLLFPSEQHWEYIQRVGVYDKCKCFCYTKRNGGESGWQWEGTALLQGRCLPHSTW